MGPGEQGHAGGGTGPRPAWREDAPQAGRARAVTGCMSAHRLLQGHFLLVSKSEGHRGLQSTRKNAGQKRAPQWAADEGDNWRLGWGGSECLTHHLALFPSHCLAVLTRNGLKRKGRGAGFCAPECIPACFLRQTGQLVLKDRAVGVGRSVSRIYFCRFVKNKTKAVL